MGRRVLDLLAQDRKKWRFAAQNVSEAQVTVKRRGFFTRRETVFFWSYV
jgi:hypothetical protein